MTRNNKVRYIFLIQEGFVNRLTQIYGDLEIEATVEYRLWELTQWGSAIEYTTQFQMYMIQIKWNKEALIL
jgi:carbohydrate-selective porin OprB